MCVNSDSLLRDEKQHQANLIYIISKIIALVIKGYLTMP